MNTQKKDTSNEKGVDDMATTDVKRYCTILESLEASCKEVKAMREGKQKKNTWDEFKKEMLSDKDN